MKVVFVYTSILRGLLNSKYDGGVEGCKCVVEVTMLQIYNAGICEDILQSGLLLYANQRWNAIRQKQEHAMPMCIINGEKAPVSFGFQCSDYAAMRAKSKVLIAKTIFLHVGFSIWDTFRYKSFGIKMLNYLNRTVACIDYR